MFEILAIEDELSYHEIYSQVLSSKGYRFRSAFSGAEGLQSIATNKPDLLFLDMELPDMTGLEILNKLKEIDSELPVIAISGVSSLQNDPEIICSSQLHRYFVKPAPMALLTTVVDNILAHKASDLMETQKLKNKFIITECLGKGAMGEVYRGVQGDRTIVVKMLSKKALEEESNHQRFIREANLIKEIDHPNVIEIYEIVNVDGIPCILMENFSGGVSLDKYLKTKGGVIEVKETLEIILQTASGMAAAHREGVIHRDLKPSNLLYCPSEGLLKVIDFGAAKQVDDEQKLTMEGAIIGTPYYMSPEQCSNRQLDHRTDIYSLGVIFYQLIVGRIPFQKSSVIETLGAHLYSSLSWPVGVEVQDDIRIVIEKMMVKDPSMRYQTMQDVENDLQMILKSLFRN